MKIGLKLWSVNTDAYLREARRLYAEKIFDYLELYVVPGTQETLPHWLRLRDELNLPFAIHAPHSAHGVNLADAAKRGPNGRAYGEVRLFADRLGAERIIVHGGAYPYPSNVSPDAALEELMRQLRALDDSRILLENKPFLPIDGSSVRLVGSTPDEIRNVIAEVKCGFCLDVGHAVASSNAHAVDWRSWLADFLSLRPAMIHLSDMMADSKIDQHLHLGTGTMPLADVVRLLPSDIGVSIETRRDFTATLDDFACDVVRLRSMLRPSGESVGRESPHIAVLQGIHLRRAEPRDMRAVYELSNDPVVRANSIHSDPIPWESHVVWYKKAIANAKIRFYVVETSEGRVAGVLRLNNERGGWVVTIHIGEDYRNKSLGQWMLSEIVRRTRIRCFIAFVKPANEPSKRLFMRMGYRNMGVVHLPVGAHQVALYRYVYTR